MAQPSSSSSAAQQDEGIADWKFL